MSFEGPKVCGTVLLHTVLGFGNLDADTSQE